jgi:hypothetical protein
LDEISADSLIDPCTVDFGAKLVALTEKRTSSYSNSVTVGKVVLFVYEANVAITAIKLGLGRMPKVPCGVFNYSAFRISDRQFTDATGRARRDVLESASGLGSMKMFPDTEEH